MPAVHLSACICVPAQFELAIKYMSAAQHTAMQQLQQLHSREHALYKHHAAVTGCAHSDTALYDNALLLLSYTSQYTQASIRTLMQ
jgi:hypothetical protein